MSTQHRGVRRGGASPASTRTSQHSNPRAGQVRKTTRRTERVREERSKEDKTPKRTRNPRNYGGGTREATQSRDRENTWSIVMECRGPIGLQSYCGNHALTARTRSNEAHRRNNTGWVKPCNSVRPCLSAALLPQKSWGGHPARSKWRQRLEGPTADRHQQQLKRARAFIAWRI